MILPIANCRLPIGKSEIGNRKLEMASTLVCEASLPASQPARHPFARDADLIFVAGDPLPHLHSTRPLPNVSCCSRLISTEPALSIVHSRVVVCVSREPLPDAPFHSPVSTFRCSPASTHSQAARVSIQNRQSCSVYQLTANATAPLVARHASNAPYRAGSDRRPASASACQ